MPKSGSNARPYNRNQKILMGEKIPGTKETRGMAAQSKRAAQQRVDNDILATRKKVKARIAEDTPKRARTTSLHGGKPGSGQSR